MAEHPLKKINKYIVNGAPKTGALMNGLITL